MKLSDQLGRCTSFRDGNAVIIGDRIVVVDRGDGDRDWPGVRQPAIGIRDNVGERVEIGNSQSRRGWLKVPSVLSVKALAERRSGAGETVSESLGRSASVSLAGTLVAESTHRGGAALGDGNAVVIGNRIICH
ncbi:MAG: hypothetical protein R3E68_02440 [Burkholderiaceae bacterium]